MPTGAKAIGFGDELGVALQLLGEDVNPHRGQMFNKCGAES